MMPCMAERTYYSAATPGDLSGKKPQDFGTGRRCACGTKILRYRKGDRCGLCEDNPERHAMFAAPDTQETPMLGVKKWRSRTYPDGCTACPEDEKFSRRHAAKGLCTKHYTAARDAEKNQPTVRLHEVVDTGIDLPATDEEIASGKASKTLLPGESDPRLDGRLERGQAAAHSANPEGCPRDAHETCCNNPDECNPGRADEGQPEQSSDWPPAEIQAWLAGDGDAQDVNSVLEAIALCDFARDGGKPEAPVVLGNELAEQMGVNICEEGRRMAAFTLSKLLHQTGLVEIDGGSMFPAGEGGRDFQIRKLVGLHGRAMKLYVNGIGHAEAALGAYNDALNGTEDALVAARDVEAELEKMGVKSIVVPVLEPAVEIDPEIAAMDQIRDALTGLDRDAQIRVMQYAAGRAGIDRPAPQSDPPTD